MACPMLGQEDCRKQESAGKSHQKQFGVACQRGLAVVVYCDDRATQLPNAQGAVKTIIGSHRELLNVIFTKASTPRNRAMIHTSQGGTTSADCYLAALRKAGGAALDALRRDRSSAVA